jgi:hypothetical protein
MNLISKLGQNAQFVGGCAHFFFAGYVVFALHSYALATAIVITAGASVKEFWFDAKYETAPPQTFVDNLEDFLTYAAGAWITYFLIR